ncbi:glycosyltransferase [Algibacter amylolyticus]|uniref:Glycosyltransferase n=1 Tax=Algibacter amylolyticus TaxID=1608400 RepID=A0A5M7BAZ8_9FLAO|nr:glycosyltransferase family 2 protein [Algibacter amylolyticus]KAA5824415.1 glycosyltransferase [Algibacter amylolyticus]MBB5269527.1 glycosyltransferase involved in cell wall biosynthesis [Algibacter amylolyticus]TSJ75188.1 glycosyltransferase [Algibacter amylolyticus]
MKIEVSVIISTYNSPLWLEKVLWSYDTQTYKNFEVIIADDGSGEETMQLIASIKNKLSYPVQHIWHEDNGFQKTIILNKATISSKGDYLVYTDGDCIARKDFLEVHVANRKAGCYLSGGYFKLPEHISKLISKDDIYNQSCFDIKWLKKHGLKSSFKNNKLTARGLKMNILNFITPTKSTWNGHNSSAYKKDILNVNGYDERMQYGGEDRELGERLVNAGMKAKRVRYSAICLHLYHERGYVNPEMIAVNKSIRLVTKTQKLTKTAFGNQRVNFSNS